MLLRVSPPAACSTKTASFSGTKISVHVCVFIAFPQNVFEKNHETTDSSTSMGVLLRGLKKRTKKAKQPKTLLQRHNQCPEDALGLNHSPGLLLDVIHIRIYIKMDTAICHGESTAQPHDISCRARSSTRPSSIDRPQHRRKRRLLTNTARQATFSTSCRFSSARIRKIKNYLYLQDIYCRINTAHPR